MKIDVNLRAFPIPDYVYLYPSSTYKKEDGFKESPKLHLKELSEDTLNKLCCEFRTNIFIKAEKEDPRKQPW